MHEAGLAAAVVAAIREHGLGDRDVRVLVSGGHDDADAFDASLRFHMTIAAPELDQGRIEIVHLPSDRWCPSCGERFAAVGDADCPACGRATMAERSEERLELEVLDDDRTAPLALDERGSEGPIGHQHGTNGPGSSDPSEGDPRPSAHDASGPQA